MSCSFNNDTNGYIYRYKWKKLWGYIILLTNTTKYYEYEYVNKKEYEYWLKTKQVHNKNNTNYDGFAVLSHFEEFIQEFDSNRLNNYCSLLPATIVIVPTIASNKKHTNISKYPPV